MRVGVFVEGLSPAEGGGYTFESDVLSTLMELTGETRHDFVIFHPRTWPEGVRMSAGASRVRAVGYSRTSRIEGVVSRLGRRFSIFQKVWTRPGYLDRLAREAGIRFMWFLTPSAIRLDLPYMTIVWDMQHRLQPWFPELAGDWGWHARERTYSWFLPRATAIIAGTQAGCKEIELFYGIPPERIRILPHPTPRFALNAAPDQGSDVLKRYGIPPNYLLYPAQFWSHKNHANLLFAMRRLRDDHHLSLPIVLVGSDKGNQGYIRRLAKDLDLESSVHFPGFVGTGDLVGLYRRALALTYMSFFGPENLPPLEAFALGCPVVASHVSGAQEQLGDAALLVDPRSPEQIASAIRNLHDNPGLRETLVQRGRKRAASWTGREFVRGVFTILDEFESVCRCWGP